MKPALLGAAFFACSLAIADDGAWPVKFSEASSKEMAAVHEALLASRLEGVLGVPVSNVVWKADAIEVRIKSGTVYLEPPIENAPVGAFFVGEATAHFAPAADEQRREIQFLFGQPALDGEPVTHGYFFTLSGSDLLAQLGVTAAPSVPFDATKTYGESKQALRQRGLDTLDAFLNRDGRARGSALALLAAPQIRIDASKSALLVLRYDPAVQEESSVEIYGHAALASSNPLKFRFDPSRPSRRRRPDSSPPRAT